MPLNIGTGPTAVLAATQTCAASGELFNPALTSTYAPPAAAALFKGWQTFGNMTLAQTMLQMAQSLGFAWRVDYITGSSYFALDLFAIPALPLLPTNATVIETAEGVGLDYDIPQLDMMPLVGMLSPDGSPINEIILVMSEDRFHLQLRSQQLNAYMPVTTNIASARLYSGTVLTPNPDGTYAVVPDNISQIGPGWARCPVRGPCPATTVKALPGARVLVDFDNGDPSKLPTIIGWDALTTADTLLTMTFGLPAASSFLTRDDLLQALFTALETWLNAHTHPTGVGPSGPPIMPWTGPTPTACQHLKSV
jgi:hypothetical protein